MMARWERRQTAIRAAEAEKNNPTEQWSSWWEVPASSCDETEPRGRFRRTRSQPRPSKLETRNDDQDAKTRRGRSQSQERTSSKNIDLSNSETTSDASVLSRRVDHRQRKVVYKSFSESPLQVLTVEVEENPPTPKAKDHVILKVAASTVSYSDCLIRRGMSFEVLPATSLPATPGMDVVGTIIQVGEKVKNFNVGDRVAALVRTGGNARYISVSASDLVAVPRACNSADAACMVSTYMTAYQSIRLATNNSFRLEKKKVFITGGTEPVGQALIQLCFRAGATEVFASGPKCHHKYIRAVLGAQPLPVDPKLWIDTMKGSMDIAFDGTCYDGLASVSSSLNDHGILISVGMSALLNRETPGILGAPVVAYWEKFKSNVMPHSTSFEVWNSFKTDRDAYKLDLEILFYLLKKRFIKPHIAKRVSLAEVANAQNTLEDEKSRGEIVCLPWKRLGLSVKTEV